LPVPFWLRSGVQYLFAPLPPFWIAKLCRGQNMLFLPPAVLVSLIWVWFLYQRFERKIR
jgi:fluoroquinolone transport system permease protein